jgi:hypothetical protein
MKMEQAECSETSDYKIQTLGHYPEESIQHSEHGESLKSRKVCPICLISQFSAINLYINMFQAIIRDNTGGREPLVVGDKVSGSNAETCKFIACRSSVAEDPLLL